MATGRMLNRRICKNRDINDLSSDTCRLAFSWTIPHLDRDGRTSGESIILKNYVFPWRHDITVDQFQNFIKEWADKGFIFWYEVNGTKYLQFSKFKENNKYMRYEREAESEIPPIDEAQKIYDPAQKTFISTCSTPDPLPTNSGPTPTDNAEPFPAQVNGMEINEKEINRDSTGIPRTTPHPIFKNLPKERLEVVNQFTAMKQKLGLEKIQETAQRNTGPPFH